jgi:hypothetical protein
VRPWLVLEAPTLVARDGQRRRHGPRDGSRPRLSTGDGQPHLDVDGRVDIDSLSDSARNNYFYARTVIGRELSMPAVHPISLN